MDRLLRSVADAITRFGAGPARRARRTTVSRPTSSQAGRRIAYAPERDGSADPGEIVWTWVPYEDDPRRGKDRPVLVVGHTSRGLLGLMLSSQDDRDGDRHWHPLGTGDWDKQRRPSWVRLDRVLEVAERGIRREGAILDRKRFDEVAEVLRQDYGWE